MEFIVLAAIAYAAARGIESMAADVNRNYGSKVAERTAKAVAKQGAKSATTAAKKGVPATFDPATAAPRTATVGTKAAAGVATLAAHPAAHWRSFLAGYRAAWPTAREEVRNGMAERAARRAAEREARKAARADGADGEEKAVAAASTEPESTSTTAEPESAAAPAPTPAGEAPTAPAETPAATAEPDAIPSVPPSTDSTATPEPTARPALSIVKTAPTGDAVSIPEVRTLDGLINALAIIKGASLMRAEEAAAIAADDATMAARLDSIEAALADVEVDPGTLAEIAKLSDLIFAQSNAAQEHGVAAQNAADLATGAADAAQKSHGGINEAVRSAPIQTVAERGYYNR